jgi:hypothetical protein
MGEREASCLFEFFSETHVQPVASLFDMTGGAGNKPLSGRISTSF